MRNNNLPEVKMKLNSPKRKQPKSEWQEEFRDKVQFSNWGDLDFLNNENNIEKLFEKFIGEDKQKVQVKCKDGMIQIARID